MNALALAAILPFCLAAHSALDPAFDSRAGEVPSVNRSAAVPVATPVAQEERDDRVWVTINAASPEQRSAAAAAGVALERIEPGLAAGVAARRALDRLRRAGLRFTSRPLNAEFQALDFPPADSAFHNYQRMSDDLNSLAGSAPGLASIFSIGSVKGYALLGLRLNTTASGTAASAKPGIVFFGTHHAREHLSTEVPLLLAKYLIERRTEPGLAKLLDGRDIYILPMVNPTGVEYDIRDGKYHMHRKNTRKNRHGSVGVDLNRNYGWHWGEGGASSDEDDETYRGPSAFSEPETKAVKAFIEKHDNIKILLSYHTFSELILYPWGHTDDPISAGPALAAYKAMAQTMAGMTGYTPEQSSALYIASGDLCDWSWGARRVFSFTFELTPKSMWEGGFYPGAGAIATTFAANLQPALYLIGLADDPLRAAQPAPAGASK